MQTGARLASLCLLIVLPLSTGCASRSCDEDAAANALKGGQDRMGFELLIGCEDDPSASADALIMLAVLYGDDSLDHETDRRERLARSWQLLQKAALTGDKSAIVTLGSVIEGGDEELGLEANVDVADCLLAVTETDDLEIASNTYSPDAVRGCLEMLKKTPPRL